MKKFNINNTVLVKLSKKGKEIYDKYLKEAYEKYGISIAEYHDKDGFVEFQLWELMSLFGDSCYGGSESFAEHCTIYFKDSDLEED